MAIGGKGQSNLWLNPRMLPSLGSVGIQLGTCKYPGNVIPAFGAIDSRLVVGLALCICGTLGKGTLCTYPSFRVPTVMPPLVVSSRQLVVVLSSLVVLSLHRPLVLSSCWRVVALHVLAPPSRPLIVVHRRHHETPLNAAAILNTSATIAIERRLYCPPLQQLPSITTVKSNANAHLLPSPLSNADARHRHPPPLMSISIVASSSPSRNPHCHHHQMLLLLLNDPPLCHH